jgi:hypothetical protein
MSSNKPMIFFGIKDIIPRIEKNETNGIRVTGVTLSANGVPNPISGNTKNKVKTSKFIQLKFIESNNFSLMIIFLILRKVIRFYYCSILVILR